MAKFNMSQILNKASLADNEKIKNEPYKVVSLSVFDLQPSENNFYSVEDIAELKSSIEMFGVKQNLTVRETEPGKYRIIAGHRRHKACRELVAEGKKQFEYVPCAIEAEPDGVTEQLLLIMTNSTTRQLTDWEKIQQVDEIKRLLTEYRSKNPIEGRTREIIADILDTSTTQIARMEAIANNLEPKLKEHLKENNINISKAYEAAGLPKEKQKEVIEEIKEKGSVSLQDIKNKKLPKEPVAEIKRPVEFKKNEGLKLKYNVFKVSDGSPVYDCFVLRPDRDKAALAALQRYAEVTENKELARDILKWIRDIRDGV